MTNNAHRISSDDVQRRQIRLIQALFAGAATVTALALFSAGPTHPETAAGVPQLPQAVEIESGSAGGSIIAVNDDDTSNPSSGDIFTQNAQDQSTA